MQLDQTQVGQVIRDEPLCCGAPMAREASGVRECAEGCECYAVIRDRTIIAVRHCSWH
ncbi:hypothetical protein [Streptomyces griseofuscus]|uniref:hypothetical protein n=1 Tax=Streptomyces griseofuscus TaxID=146922 RepID=UPI0033E3F628